MKLKIYNNKTNKLIFKTKITKQILFFYSININSNNFSELFETEILNDIFTQLNIQSNNHYYSLTK